MKYFEDIYNEYCAGSSDINEHLPTLRKYATGCDSIFEMGTRSGLSTHALILGKPKRFRYLDIDPNCNMPEFNKQAKLEGIDCEFIHHDSMTYDMTEGTDLLFIDTCHNFQILREELRRHAPNVSKYIIMHDTTTFGFRDESPHHHSDHNTKGLYWAMMDFVTSNIRQWIILEKFNNNNGLTVLSRIGN